LTENVAGEAVPDQPDDEMGDKHIPATTAGSMRGNHAESDHGQDLP
jgi:hypothetical protein